MSKTRQILVAGAALASTVVASAAVVEAADLYGVHGGRGSIKDGPVYAAPRGCPSWYARIDGGYSAFDRPSMSQVGIDDLVNQKLEGTGNIGFGFGHYFTCNIRGDITFDWRFQSNVSGFNANPWAPNYGSMKWGYESFAVMSNYYYDFNPGSRISPYIGFGFGAVQNSFAKGKGTVANGSLNAPVGTAVTVAAHDSWHVAGAAMAGFVMNVTDRLKLDTGYRFLYMGGGQTGQTTNAIGGIGGVIHIDSLHAHEFRMGLRYDIR
jgi:opacity protein-like surface antigen